jgi:SulP family sulfate permease
MFLIRRGVVRIHLPLGNGKHVNLAGFGRGDFFGDMAFLDQSVRSADALAATSVDLYVISRASFDEFIKSHPALAARVLLRLARALAIRLRHTDNELRALQEC